MTTRSEAWRLVGSLAILAEVMLAIVGAISAHDV
jgi:hypothetical protein